MSPATASDSSPSAVSARTLMSISRPPCSPVGMKLRMICTVHAAKGMAANPPTPLKNRFVATFRADGQLSEIKHHNPDGSVPREVRVYDSAGRLTEEQGWSNDILTRRVVHTYDVCGAFASAATVDA